MPGIYRLKHKILVAKYGKQKPQAEIEDVTEQIQDITRPDRINSLLEAQDIAIQTPNWKTQEQRYYNNYIEYCGKFQYYHLCWEVKMCNNKF